MSQLDLSAGKRAFVEVLIALLNDEPENWGTDSGGYTVIHHPTGMEVWISNGRPFVKLYRPEQIEFSWLQRWRAWRAIKRILKREKDAKERAELERLHGQLRSMRDNVVSINQAKSRDRAA